jgi:hypothetical protein
MKKSAVLSLALVLAAGACKDLDIPDYYAGDVDALVGGNASVSTVLTAVQGLFIGLRSSTSGNLSTLGEIGREGYSLDPANPANNTQRLVIPNTGGFSSWGTTYSNIRQALLVLEAASAVAGLTDAEKEGIRGLAKTLMAIDLLMLIRETHDAGAAIDVDRDIDDELAPVVGRAAVYDRIVDLLDEGAAHLNSGGATFAFRLPAGFNGFNTPATFREFNRAMKARVDVYMENWADALTSLGESFLDEAGSMSLGVYNSYSTVSGETVNGSFDPLPRTLVAHQHTITDAQLRANLQPDLRATEKTLPIATRLTNGITVNLKWNVYRTADAPHPIIKNEELILLRAEARLHTLDRPGALDDVNIVRVESGGLEPLPADPGLGGALTGDLLIDEILYNRRYSLLWEGGHRWIDWRRYDILDKLPPYRPNHVVFPYSPLPLSECAARNPAPAGCALPTPVVPTVPPILP